VIEVKNLTKGKEYKMILDITLRQREMLIQGGLLNLIRLKENTKYSEKLKAKNEKP